MDGFAILANPYQQMRPAPCRAPRPHGVSQSTASPCASLASFGRDCLSRWYQEATNERGIEMTKDDGREEFYGMPFAQWRDKYQTDSSADKKAEFDVTFAKNGRDVGG